MKPVYDAVLFDFDGTLADTAPDVWKSVEYAAASVGGAVPVSFMKEAENLSLPLKMIYNTVKGEAGEERFADFAEALKTHYRKLNTFEDTALYPGMENLLQKLLESGTPAYILSAKPYEPLCKILLQKGWARYFRAWYSTDSIKDGVLSKTVLLSNFMRTFLQNQKAVYIGDSPGDVISARESGIPSIGVLYGDGNSQRLLAEKPDFTARSADELLQLLFGDQQEISC